LINNRQGGRRRGRGGQRPQNLGGRPDGNRQDNRQRGNAAQLLEKYKSMARDAQLGGDRVQTEYYLQYADHYYRILGESRARFEEQRRARGDSDEDDGDDDQMEAGDEQGLAEDDGGDDRPQRNERFDRDRPQRGDRYERPERAERPERNERPARPDSADRNPRRPRYARDDGNGEDVADRQAGGDARDDNARDVNARDVNARDDNRRDDSPRGGNLESIAFDALPPAIGRDLPAPDVDADEAPRPKRRAARKPRATDGDTDVAPAA
jgi:hypothetical protein